MNTCYPIDQNRKYTFDGKIVYSPEEKSWWGQGQGFVAPTESHKRLRLPSQDLHPSADAEFFTQFHCSSHDEALAEIEKQIKATTLAIRLHGQKRQVCFDNAVANLRFWRKYKDQSEIGCTIEVLIDRRPVKPEEETTVEHLREAARAWADQPGFHCAMFAKIDTMLAAEEMAMPRCPNTYYSPRAAQ